MLNVKWFKLRGKQEKNSTGFRASMDFNYAEHEHPGMGSQFPRHSKYFASDH